MVKFDIAMEDQRGLSKVLRRAKEAGFVDEEYLSMNLTACHSNGCPLDFEKLAAAPEFDFWHDINGINRHVSRTTGKLQDFFLPRCAKPQEVRA